MTVGPYRPIHLHTFKTRIADVYANAQVSPAPELSCTLQVLPTFHGRIEDVSKVEVTLRDSSGGSTIRAETFNHGSKFEWKFDPDEVKLWWPVGYGQQTLYGLEIAALDKVSPVFQLVSCLLIILCSHIFTERGET